MGIPAPFGVAGNGVPPAGDQANIVVSGTLGAVGPGIPCPVVGNLNISVWPSINTTLTVTAGSLNATVASASGLHNPLRDVLQQHVADSMPVGVVHTLEFVEIENEDGEGIGNLAVGHQLLERGDEMRTICQSRQHIVAGEMFNLLCRCVAHGDVFVGGNPSPVRHLLDRNEDTPPVAQFLDIRVIKQD